MTTFNSPLRPPPIRSLDVLNRGNRSDSIYTEPILEQFIALTIHGGYRLDTTDSHILTVTSNHEISCNCGQICFVTATFDRLVRMPCAG